MKQTLALLRIAKNKPGPLKSVLLQMQKEIFQSIQSGHTNAWKVIVKTHMSETLLNNEIADYFISEDLDCIWIHYIENSRPHAVKLDLIE